MKLCTVCNTLYGMDFEFCPRDETFLVPAPKETMAMYDPMRGLLLDGRYRLSTPVGCGTLGEVYAARFESMEKPVAVKMLRKEFTGRAQLVDKFLELARHQATVSHSHIVNVTDFGVTPDGRPYFVMDWLSGGHLGEYLRNHGPMDPVTVVSIGLQLAEALHVAHEKGIIHQNLKPSNVRLVPDSHGSRCPVLTDLGLFSPSGTGETIFGRDLKLYGSPHFMAPEQVRGLPATTATDIYQTGLLLYMMLTGSTPFSASSFHDLLRAQIQSKAPSVATLNPDCPVALDRLVASMLNKDPELRPRTMKEVKGLLGNSLVRSLRKPALFAGLGVFTLALAGFAFWAATSIRSNPDAPERPEPFQGKATAETTGDNPPDSPMISEEKSIVRVFVDSVPTGARLRISGETKTAPAWFELPRQTEPLGGTADFPGRPTLSFSIVPKQPGQVFIHLDSASVQAPTAVFIPKPEPVAPDEQELMDPYK